MGKHRKDYKVLVLKGKLVIPEIDRNPQYLAIMFGSYLPAQFQSIEEEDELLDSESPTSIQLEPYGVGTINLQLDMQKFQFLKVKSSGPTKVTKIQQAQKKYDANRDEK